MVDGEILDKTGYVGGLEGRMVDGVRGSALGFIDVREMEK